MESAKVGGGGPPPTLRPPSPMHLEFVDVQDPQARSRARSHVVRGWRRQNRLKDIRYHSQSASSSSSKVTEGSSPENGGQPSSETSTTSSAKRPLDRNSSNKTRKSSTPPRNSSTADPKPADIVTKREHDNRRPSTILSSGMNDLELSDPDLFDTFDIDIDETDREALRHFVRFQSAHSYNLGESSPFNPNMELVLWSAQHSVPAMHSIIAIALIHSARLRGQDEPTLGMHHLGEAMRLLRERFVDVKGNLSDIVLTICGLACVNEFREAYEQSQVHVRAVMQLIRDNGGLETLNAHPCVQRYAAYVTTAGLSSGLPDLQSHKTIEHSEDHFFDGLDTSEDVVEVHAHISEFLMFISKIHKVTYKRTDEDSLARPRQKTLFHHNGLFYSILCESETDHFRSAGLGNERIHRASCLFLMALHLLVKADFPKESEDYLKDIQEIYVRNELDVRPNLRLLHHRLIQANNETRLADLDMIWQSMRFVQVFKLLTWETGLRIMTDISHFLGMTMMEHPRPAMVLQHDLSTFVNEVLEALTTEDQARKLGSLPRNLDGLLVEEPISFSTPHPPRQSAANASGS